MKAVKFLQAGIAANFAATLSVTAADPSSFFQDSNDSSVYQGWLLDSSYERSAFLQSQQEGLGAALFWSIIDDTHIQIALVAQATGWAGVGLAESGSMLGADILMYTAATNELTDAYVLDQAGTPITDDCQSWTLVNSVAEGEFVIFEAIRLLDTEDFQDRVIINDRSTLVPPTRVIAAWGDTAAPSYHGVNNNARNSVRFFGSDSGEEEEVFQKAMADEAEGSFTIQANDFLIPPTETIYHRFCWSMADLMAMDVPLDQVLHTIGIEPVVDPRTSEYVHHFAVLASEEPWDSSLDCAMEFPGFELTYVWAPGDLPLMLPPNVGSPLGSNGFKSFTLEIHYNNPTMQVGNLDSSGVRFHYTSKKREHDLGVFQTGDPQVRLNGTLVSESGGLSQYSFNCDSGCSATVVSEPVTVIREHLHMHATGVSMTNAQIRDGYVIREGGVEYWDFNQQGNLAVIQEPFDIQPGDAFRTTCNYDARSGEIFGLSSQEEMCIAFLFYYPRQVALGFAPYMCGVDLGDFMPPCEATWERRELNDLSQVGRTFGTAPLVCPAMELPSNPSAAITVKSSLQYLVPFTALICVAATIF